MSNLTEAAHHPTPPRLLPPPSRSTPSHGHGVPPACSAPRPRASAGSSRASFPLPPGTSRQISKGIYLGYRGSPAFFPSGKPKGPGAAYKGAPGGRRDHGCEGLIATSSAPGSVIPSSHWSRYGTSRGAPANKEPERARGTSSAGRGSRRAGGGALLARAPLRGHRALQVASRSNPLPFPSPSGAAASRRAATLTSRSLVHLGGGDFL